MATDWEYPNFRIKDPIMLPLPLKTGAPAKSAPKTDPASAEPGAAAGED